MASEADFKFIIGTILQQKEDSPTSKAFLHAGVTDVGDITLLTDRAIDRLKYLDDAISPPVIVELRVGYQQLVRGFNAWVETKNDEGDPIHGDWQNKATRVEFNEYPLIGFAKKYTSTTHVSAPTTVTSGGGTSGGSSFAPRARDPVFEFKKGIKRDPASFSVLKDNKQWDSVHRTLKAQTCYQDVDDILDPSYVPTTVEDIELFAEKQKYMYSVLERILQTDEGKVIVRSHDNDRNAQLIYKEFLHVMTESAEAMIDSGELLACLTSVRITDGAWRGTTKAFVLNWIDKLRLHHEVTPLSDRLPETTQRILLQNSVIGMIALQEVQTRADLMKATNGSVLTFTQYHTLLINAATSYDKRTDTKSSSNGRPRRSVFNS
jgi:hypothetical protein